MIINTPNDLLVAMRLCGFTLAFNDNKLNVTQARWIDDELENLIKLHKVGLIELLQNEHQSWKE